MTSFDISWFDARINRQVSNNLSASANVSLNLIFIYGTLFTKADILHTWIGAAFRCIALSCLFASLYIFRTSGKDGYDVGLTYAFIFGGLALDFISILIFSVSDWTFARLRKPKKDMDKEDARFDRFLNWLLGARATRKNIATTWCLIGSEYIYAYNLIESSLKIKSKRIHHTKGHIHRYFDAIIQNLYIDRAIRIIIQETVLVSAALNHIRKKTDLYISSLFILHRKKYYLLYPVRVFLKCWFGIPVINYLLEFFGIPDQINEIRFTSRERLTREFWEFIFMEVKHRCLFILGSESSSYIYSARGDWILRDMKIEDYYEKLLPYVTQVNYDQSILVWHVATELLHQTNEDKARDDGYRDFSKTLSDYMMYLLIAQPSLMSTVAGIDKVRFTEAITEAKKFQEAKKLFQRTHLADSIDAKVACKAVLDSYKADEQGNQNADGYRSKSVLFQASMLAKELQRIQTQLSNKQMWQVVSKVWLEMLCYAATHCDSKQHAAQLNNGGQLINFVWLLMAHFGFGEQFRTSKEDSRAKLILDKATSCLV